ncbi:MAG: hypothetical protein U9Q74_09840, partial [Gemmatimonadota bacterium]|nr:hypothetical protein [Gemmatimonadota bacterium]
MFNVRDDRTAVIVVHGVGASEPGAASGGFSAAMVNALRDRGAPAPMFEHRVLSLPLNGVQLPPTADGALPAEDLLLRRQVGQYAGPDAQEALTVPAYAIRSDRDDLPPIDVYGAWWGDIGSFGEGALRAVLYMLRFVTRIFSLGLTSMEAASDAIGTRFWTQGEWWQRQLGRITFGVIPILMVLIGLVFMGITFPHLIDPYVAEAIAVVVAIIAVLAALLPQALAKGTAGPGDWFLRPFTVSIMVLLLVVSVSLNPAGRVPPHLSWVDWLTPWHVLVAEWLLFSIVIAIAGRQLLALGGTAPRRPDGAPAPPRTSGPTAAHGVASGDQPWSLRRAFVTWTWPALVLAPASIVVSSGALGLALLLVLIAARMAWLRRSPDAVAGRAPLRRFLAPVWVRAVVITIVAQAAAPSSIPVAAGAFAALSLLVPPAALIQWMVAGARRARLPGPVFFMLTVAAAALPPLLFGGEGLLVSMPLVIVLVYGSEALLLLQPWWNTRPAAAAPPPAPAHTRLGRAREFVRDNLGLIAVALIALALATEFIDMATPGGSAPADSTELLTQALSQLQVRLVYGLVAMWAVAGAIVIWIPVSALAVAIGHRAKGADGQHIRATLRTGAITSSATLMLVLLVQSVVMHLGGGDAVIEDAKRYAAAADTVAAVQPATAGNVTAPGAPVVSSPDTAATVATLAKRPGSFFKLLTATIANAGRPAAQQRFTLNVLGHITHWADYQLFALIGFGLLMALVAAWTMLPSIRSDAYPGARQWGDAVQLGRWVSTGSRALGLLAAAGIPLVVIVPGFVALWANATGDPVDALVAEMSDKAYGAIVGAGAALVLTQAGAILTAIRPVLALFADVEIYLRVAPFNRTPRARLLDR